MQQLQRKIRGAFIENLQRLGREAVSKVAVRNGSQ